MKLKIKRKMFSQNKINLINLTIAVLALIFSVPSTLNQIRQFISERSETKTTEIVYYSVPDTSSLKREKGECWESIASERRDAARCINDNDHYLYDPCFYVTEEDNSDVYFCPTEGYKSDKGVLIKTSDMSLREFRIKELLDDNKGHNYPWMVVFEDGTTCNLFTGTVEIAFDNRPILYGCTSNLLVTDHIVESGKYIFGCKKKGISYYGNCVAKVAVF